MAADEATYAKQKWPHRILVCVCVPHYGHRAPGALPLCCVATSCFVCLVHFVQVGQGLDVTFAEVADAEGFRG